jgi:hypothetical protein
VPTDGLEIVLLIDTSGSMNENAALESAKDAAVAFLAELPTEVPVGVVGFSDSPSLVSPLTTDRVAIAAAVGQLRAAGRTAMYDAIVFGDSLFSGGTTDRQFVLLSDGGDTASVATLDDARAVTTNVRTNAIEIVTSESNSEAMASLADAGRRPAHLHRRPGGTRRPLPGGGAVAGEPGPCVVRVAVDRGNPVHGEVTTPFGPLTGTTVVELPAVHGDQYHHGSAFPDDDCRCRGSRIAAPVVGCCRPCGRSRRPTKHEQFRPAARAMGAAAVGLGLTTFC